MSRSLQQANWSTWISISRWISLAAAGILSAIVLTAPNVIASNASELDHGELTLVMLGISLGFVHGLGFSLDRRWQRLLVSPITAWPLMGLGLYQWLGS